MTPTLRKLYHRRGKLLSYLNEIDRQIEELRPQEGDLVFYDDGEECYIALYGDSSFIYTDELWIQCNAKQFTTILEKGFER